MQPFGFSRKLDFQNPAALDVWGLISLAAVADFQKQQQTLKMAKAVANPST